MNKHNPLPTEDLNSTEAYPFLDGADTITLRISRFAEDGKTPLAYQCIVRCKDDPKKWGLGIRPNPVAALTAAIDSWFQPKVHEIDHVPGEEPDVEDLLG